MVGFTRLSSWQAKYQWYVDDILVGNDACEVFSAGLRGVRTIRVTVEADSLTHTPSKALRLSKEIQISVEPRQLSDDDLIALDSDDLIEGGDGDDIIHGLDGDDTIIGGVGSDHLYGGAGVDTYYFNAGDGRDVISESNNGNILKFGPGILPSDIRLVRRGENRRIGDGVFIDISFSGESIGNSIFFGGQFSRSSPNGSEGGYEYPMRNAIFSQFRFSNETVWDLDIDTIKQMVVEPTDGDDFLLGYYKESNTLVGEKGRDILIGGDFDDELYGGEGADYESSCREEGEGGGQQPTENCDDHEGLFGGNGNDLIYGGPGNDFLRGGFEHTGSSYLANMQEFGYASFDPPDLAGADADQLFGEGGTDYLQGGAGDDLLDGGRDSDFLAGGTGSDTYQFSESFGVDVIEQYRVVDRDNFNQVPANASDHDTIKFLAPITSTDVRLERDLRDLLVIHKNNMDRITVKNYFATAQDSSTAPSDEAIDTIEFSDQVVWDQSVIGATLAVNTAPLVTLISPSIEPLEFPPATQLTLVGQAIDPEDGDLSDSLAWYIQLAGSREALGQGREVSLTMPSQMNTELVVLIEVTDSGGITSSVSNTLRSNDVDLAPQLTLVAPVEGSQSSLGDAITLSATAIDQVDGDISNDITWLSDLDGALGQGSELSVQLSVGAHTLTASINDSANNPVSQMVTVNVQEPIPVADPERLNVQVSPIEPVLESAVVTIDGLAEGSSGVYEYRFKIKGAVGSPSAGEWIDLQGWSSSAQASWDTSGYFGKTNKIKVLARVPGDPLSKIKQVVRGFEVSNPVETVDLAIAPLGPQPQQVPITLTANAGGGSGDYEFKFKVKGSVTSPSAGEWIVLQDWSSANQAVWSSTSGYVGDDNRVKVVVRNRTYHDGKVRAVVKKIAITSDSI